MVDVALSPWSGSMRSLKYALPDTCLEETQTITPAYKYRGLGISSPLSLQVRRDSNDIGWMFIQLRRTV